MDMAELFDDLANLPRLDGARCREVPYLFDTAAGLGGYRGARQRALAVCQGCPCLQQCREWLHNLPLGQRPFGVVAGEIVVAGHSGSIRLCAG